MLLQELTKKLEQIKKQELKLKEKEKEIAANAVKDRVLEVCVEDLLNELRNYGFKKVRIDYTPLYAPVNCANKIELAKLWIQNRKPKMQIKILTGDCLSICLIAKNFADVRLNNGDPASEHIYMDYCTIGIKNEYRNTVMLNINPLDKSLKNDLFRNAVYNCVTKREVENQLTEHFSLKSK